MSRPKGGLVHRFCFLRELLHLAASGCSPLRRTARFLVKFAVWEMCTSAQLEGPAFHNQAP